MRNWQETMAKNQENSEGLKSSKLNGEKEDVESHLLEGDSKEDTEPSNPNIDGGYAWVIVTASFLMSVIVDGVCYSFGIFLIEFLQYYGGSKAKVAWVGSVLNGTYLTIGKSVNTHIFHCL